MGQISVCVKRTLPDFGDRCLLFDADYNLGCGQKNVSGLWRPGSCFMRHSVRVLFLMGESQFGEGQETLPGFGYWSLSF